jgi:hypothetical protein
LIEDINLFKSEHIQIKKEMIMNISIINTLFENRYRTNENKNKFHNYTVMDTEEGKENE